MSEVTYAERVQRTIRRVLVAARGVEAAELVARLEAVGCETVAVFDADDAEAPHLDVAAWAVPLPTSLARDAAPVDAAAALCGLALDAGADAVCPGRALAGEPSAARVVANLGLAWVGCTPDTLEALADASALRGRLATLGVPLAEPSDAASVAVVVFGDGSGARACADATVWEDGAACPAEVTPSARGALWDLAARVVAAQRLAGPVCVDLALVREGARVVRVSPGLPAWHALVVQGDGDVPLAAAAVRVAAGEDLAAPSAPATHTLDVRVRATSGGVVEALDVPEDADVTVACAPGQVVEAGTVLLALRASGPTATAARVRTHETLLGVGVVGVTTNQDAVASGLLPARGGPLARA
jgi:hypothetical protein